MTKIKEPLKINIIYEDNHILVVKKPINIPVQKDDSKDPNLLSILKNDIKIRYKKPGNVYIGLVHRLDRPVGGIMVFAKTSKAASRLSEQIRLGKIKKTYLAIVHGVFEKSKGHLKHYILKDKNRNIVKVVSSLNKNAKKAILDYTVKSNKQGLSLVKIDLLTGRSHQIRVQFAEIGHPLFGDQKYGRDKNKPGQQIALWAYEIQFEHPTKRETMKFSCMPSDVYPWDLFEKQRYKKESNFRFNLCK